MSFLEEAAFAMFYGTGSLENGLWGEDKVGEGESGVHVRRRHSAESRMFENIMEEISVSAA